MEKPALRFHKKIGIPKGSFLEPLIPYGLLWKQIKSLPATKWKTFQKRQSAFSKTLGRIFANEVSIYLNTEMPLIRQNYLLKEMLDKYRPVRNLFPKFIDLLHGMTDMWLDPKLTTEVVRRLKDFRWIMENDLTKVKSQLGARKKGKARDSLTTSFEKRRLITAAVHKAYGVIQSMNPQYTDTAIHRLCKEAIDSYFGVSISIRQIKGRIENQNDSQHPFPRSHLKKSS